MFWKKDKEAGAIVLQSYLDNSEELAQLFVKAMMDLEGKEGEEFITGYQEALEPFN